jgi:mannose-P-dolichol utilization defect protein 1
MVYPVRSRYPLSSYVEYICLLSQSLFINCLIRLYAGVSPLAVAAGALAFCCALAAALRGMPMPAAKLCAPFATGLLSASLVPQVARNFAAHSSGGWSAITAGLGVAGNMIRLYTTMQLAGGDRLLLAQFGIGTILNAVMLGQVVAWGS